MDLLKESKMDIYVHAPLVDSTLLGQMPLLRKASLDEIINSIKKAEEIGAKCVTIHSGVPSLYLYEKGILISEFENQTRKLVETAERLKIKIAYENVPGTLLSTADSFLQIFKNFNSKYLGMTFDISHSELSGETDNFLKIKKKIFNVHINDCNLTEDEHLPLSQGKVNWIRIVKRLKEFYFGAIQIELFDDVIGAIESKKLLEKVI